ncbi:carboxyl transferase domain-containing protein [Mobilicoccus caccae]|uniref:CoA carboxyltransferase C-terminal domain-containing protein n=1 Tax=Mobilicoccus caccae TaxID=1859295 RepID=A0ABQ6IV78_9MICO|nr:carboxyl transferase domain-containing protein [Mobilicoccus caccae]GMA40619.1 hypothetical protein GCM10025883_26640 [Mobilicoccus caccae]
MHTPEEIGPAPEQARNGVVQLLVDDEEAAVEAARRMLSFFSARRLEPGEAADQRLLRQVVPENRKRVYDVRRAIDVLVDAGSFLELSAEYAPGMVTGLARLDGHAVAVVANDPAHLGGAIDADEARCLQDFLGLVARHEFPLVVLCDTPGFMVGPETERAGTVRLFSALFGAGAAVRTPIVLVVLRKAYGLGAQAMAGGSLRTPDLVLCWPTAELGPMGLEGAVRLGFRRELDEQPDQESRDALERRLIEQAHEQAKAVNAAEVFEVDDVIDPADTRQHIVQIISSPGSRRDQ